MIKRLKEMPSADVIRALYPMDEELLDYINRLAKIQDKVSDRVIIIPRIYTNKERLENQTLFSIAYNSPCLME